MSDSIRPLFIPTLNSGVVYWRMYNFVNAGFRTKSLDGHLLWWQKNLQEMHPWQIDLATNAYRARILGEVEACVRQADVVVIGMIHTGDGLNLVTGIREMYGLPVVMEIDDNILSTPEYNPAGDCYEPNSEFRKRAILQMRESDAVIVSTPYLKTLYSEFNDNIYVIPNAIDFKLWGRNNRVNNRGKITIGWAGGASHDDDLAIIIPAVEALTEKYPKVEFRFVHGISPALKGKKGVVHVVKFARIDQYPKYLARQGFDIGIAPLADNAFNRGKSNLRWLEYSALKIPTVASNVGHFAETIRPGLDGILCDTPDDFTRELETLIKDRSLRWNLGQAAYDRVQSDFNVNGVVQQYKATLEEIRERGQIKRFCPEYKASNFKQVTEAVL